MSDPPSREVTRLLQEIGEGRDSAADRLLPVVYAELRRLARARLVRERSAAAHQATSLVHEAYLRLVGDREYRWDNRAHFFAAAGEAMRRILIERARRRARLKHGGGQRRVTFDEDSTEGRAAVTPDPGPPPEELLALDDALIRLDARDAAMGNVVKLRYFAGLTVAETARALEMSPRSVNRLWTAARAWLHAEMTGSGGPAGE